MTRIITPPKYPDPKPMPEPKVKFEVLQLFKLALYKPLEAS